MGMLRGGRSAAQFWDLPATRAAAAFLGVRACIYIALIWGAAYQEQPAAHRLRLGTAAWVWPGVPPAAAR